MIEFLDEHADKSESSGDEYWIEENHYVIDHRPMIITWGEDTELCDALWEVVKEVLEEK